MTGDPATDVLVRVELLAREAERVQAELDAALVEAQISGVSQRDLAAALRTSKSSVNRRLLGSTSRHAFSGDEQAASFRAEMHEARLTLAKLKMAEQAGRVQIRKDHAALIAEANEMTRIGPDDLA